MLSIQFKIRSFDGAEKKEWKLWKFIWCKLDSTKAQEEKHKKLIKCLLAKKRINSLHPKIMSKNESMFKMQIVWWKSVDTFSFLLSLISFVLAVLIMLLVGGGGSGDG